MIHFIRNTDRMSSWAFGIVSLFIFLSAPCSSGAEKAVPRGFVVCIGAESLESFSADWQTEGTVYQGLDVSAVKVSELRKKIRAADCYGRISADHFDGKHLPYVDGSVNHLVIGAAGAGVTDRERVRVLAPGGVLVANGKQTVKPVPEAMDEWTHFMYDASGIGSGNDQAVGPPRHLQWEAGPRYSRSHENMSSVSAMVTSGGRVFSIMDEGSVASIYQPPEWTLTARDAFSGVLLWKIPIQKWHARLFPLKSGPTQLMRRLVSVGNRVYTTLGLYAPVSELDAVTGEILRTFEGTEYAEELLVVDGALVVVSHDNGKELPFKGRAPKASPEFARGELTLSATGNRSISVINLKSGKVHWKKTQGKLMSQTTVVLDGTLFLISDGVVRSIELTTGKMLWEQPVDMKKVKVSLGFVPTILAHKGILYIAIDGTLSALNMGDGKTLWSAPCAPEGFKMPSSIFIVNGMIWDVAADGVPYKAVKKDLLGADTTNIPRGPGVTAKHHFVGYDLKTGKVLKDIPMYGDQGFGAMHHRCHMPRASGDYLLTGFPGIEFIDTNTGTVQTHSWIRGACLYGFLPANGLIYTPPHPCACYAQSLLSGFNAVTGARSIKAVNPKAADRLEPGPAYNQLGKQPATASESWATFRGDASRSGFSKTTVSSTLSEAWKTELKGKLTQPVVANGLVFVASVDTHTVYALDENSGKIKWSFVTGARVDSPPTVYKGCVIFGSHDGYVYNVRASDGQLVWRFLAAPNHQRIISYDQPESVWPVHGSVLVEQESLYFVAGRNAFLDGGIVLYRLDPLSGKIQTEKNICMLGADGEQPSVLRLQMDAAKPDVLTSDGQRIFMRNYAMDLEGKSVEQAFDHLFCPTGFLDAEWFRRSYWLYGNVYFSGAQGWATSGNVLPSGRIMAIGADRVYGFGRNTYPAGPSVGQQMYASGEKEILFASKKLNYTEAYKLSGVKSPYAVKKPKKPKAPKGEKGKKKKASLPLKPHVEWSADLGMRVMGMVLTSDQLFVAGTKGNWIISRDALDGAEGISLMVISTDTGKTVQEIPLSDRPLFDGMCAANKKLFISTENGHVLCLEGSK